MVNVSKEGTCMKLNQYFQERKEGGVRGSQSTIPAMGEYGVDISCNTMQQ